MKLMLSISLIFLSPHYAVCVSSTSFCSLKARRIIILLKRRKNPGTAQAEGLEDKKFIFRYDGLMNVHAAILLSPIIIEDRN
jgi:hypothetical protein